MFIPKNVFNIVNALKLFFFQDLATRNVLLKGGRCQVSDFGMARVKEVKEDTAKTVQEIGPLKVR